MSNLFDETIYIPDMDSAFKVYGSHWRKTSAPWRTDPLHFSIFELNVLLDGVQDVVVDGTAYEMNAGDVFLIQPGVFRRVAGTRGHPITYFVLHFDVEDHLLRTILIKHRCGLHVRDSGLERDIRQPLEQLVSAMQTHRQQNMGHPAIRMKLLSQMFALFAALGSIDDAEAVGGTNDAGFLIACRLAEQIEHTVKIGGPDLRSAEGSLARMAGKLGYSASYCYRVFRKAFGTSPQKYMSGVILHRARLELLNAEQPLDRIAEKLGFQDGLHFSKQFKRWTGYSPSEYRRNWPPFT